jgi:tetratricopeptide (TPR) repeat protein
MSHLASSARSFSASATEGPTGEGRYADADPLYKRALATWKKALGPDHRDVAQSLNNLADLYLAQGRYADAEPLYKRALASTPEQKGSTHSS